MAKIFNIFGNVYVFKGVIIIDTYNLFINGEWRKGKKEEYFPSVNPFNQKEWAKITQASAEDVQDAIEAADKAFELWRNVNGKERAKLLNTFANLLEENSERLATLESLDNGKVIRETLTQMKFAVRNYRFFAGYTDKIYGKTIPLDNNDLFNYTKREPLGVVALITSWNSPISILTNKLAPALATGNTVVIKPSEQASVTTLELAKIIDEAGFPSGVVNVVTGDYRVGNELTQTDRIQKVSFTGGTETGKIIAKNSGANLIKNTLELGGKSPNIIFEDANLNAALAGAMAGIFGASGQTCIAGSRLLVQESIYESFLDQLVAKASNIKLGNPLEKETEMGPVANEKQFKIIQNLIKEYGGKVVLGYKDFEDQLGQLKKGYFIPPTILAPVDNESTIAQNEIFGPVLCVIPFKDENDAVQKANQTKFGLAAGIWTENVKKAHRVANRIQAGTIWVNTYRTTAAQAPFGGFKSSGYGKERGVEALYEYTQVKNVMVNLSDDQRDPFSIQN
ncbi:aldehyde dehydrogenase [Pseudalkalibacillus sp. A8]|uniref:aldehyde dehydrogenase n=1 Tax=Pseudalkalibacillus sp. A8 TaxID=3382641 RepID=UPI0038B4AA1D